MNRGGYIKRMARWLIVGINGVTCGGKTTLANSLYNFFSSHKDKCPFDTPLVVGDTFLIAQDSYFLPATDSRHQWVESLNHINWEIMSSMDMDKMISDVRSLLNDDLQVFEKTPDDPNSNSTFQNRVNVLILEGFILFNHPQLLQLCQVKFHLHVPYERCFERRKIRVYDPPDVVGYFESVVWPMYELHYREIRDSDDIVVLNGDLPKERIFKFALNHIYNFLYP